MFILKNKNLFLSISLIAVIFSLISILTFGFKKSIDFTGGARVTVSYATPVTEAAVMEKLQESFAGAQVVKTDATTFKLSLRDMKESDYTKLREDLAKVAEKPEIKEFNMIGPSVSSEIIKKSVTGFILVALAIILFITLSFWSVSGTVSSFKYGLVTIIALLHDITIPAGIFAYLGYAYGIEVDSLFIVALLTILGVSVSDTIVIFDRIRENLKGKNNGTFEEIVGKSISQSMVRSLATSIAVIVVLLALVFYGPDSTKYFALTLTIGMFVGTYSSIFVASPLLVWVSKMGKK
jgi:preprotein translocase subunit SecF